MNILYSPREILLRIAGNLKHQRLIRNTSQEELSKQSGVPLATIRVFEQKGQVSLSNLVKIAIALGEEEALIKLLEPGEVQTLFGKERKPRNRIRATGSRKVKRV
ncbi:MAG: helix-turn-helix domain-containing protein [Leptospirales bacterium]